MSDQADFLAATARHSGLAGFLDHLADRGFDVRISVRQRVLSLLSRLALMGCMPTDCTKLARVLGPIISRTPEEQASLGRLCNDWFHGTGGQKPPVLEVRSIGAGRRESALQRVIAAVRLRLSQPAWRIAAGLLLTITAIILVFPYIDFGPVHTDRLPDSMRYPGTSSDKIPDFLRNIPFEAFDEPTQRPWNRAWRWYIAEYDWRKWLAVATPPAILLLWLAWLLVALLAFLRRRHQREGSAPHTVRLRSVTLPDLSSRALASRLQPLLRRGDAFKRTLDVMATVDAAAWNGGLLQLRERAEPMRAEFLILLERQSEGDHLFAYGQALADMLQSNGLVADLFSINRAGNEIRSLRGNVRSSLMRLAEAYPDHRLVLVSEGQTMFDPVSGAPALWTRMLAQWPVRIMLTSRPRTAWGPLEHAIGAQLGFIVEPASVKGLAHAADLLGRPEAPSHPVPAGEATQPPVYDLLRERPRLWSGVTDPGNVLTNRLVDGLRSVLGERGFAWLAGLAAYPELRWPITLRVGAAIRDPNGRPVLALDRLLVLCRLPWLRTGRMPDWLRKRLLAELDSPTRAQVRAAFSESGGPPAGGITDVELPILTERRPGQVNAARHDMVYLDFCMGSQARARGALLEVSRHFAQALRTGPGRRLLRSAAFGSVAAIVLSFLGIALIPIDRCDLLAAKRDDRSRVGPGVTYEVLGRTPEAVVACAAAATRNPDNARLLFQNGRALHSIGNWAAANEFLEQARKLGHTEALYAIALTHLSGEGIAQDLEKARSLLHDALSRGSGNAAMTLGWIYNNGVGVIKNEDVALEYYHKMMRNGIFSTSVVAEIYIKKGDFKYAQYLLEQGYKKMDTDSMANLGYYYSNGSIGLPVDKKRAGDLFELAAEAGDATSNVNLGRYYRDGTGGRSVDATRALHYFLRGAQLGELLGFLEMGMLIQSDPELNRWQFNPLEVIRHAANEGEPRSQLELATYFQNSGQNSKSLSEAAVWYQKVLDNTKASENQRDRARERLESLAGAPSSN